MKAKILVYVLPAIILATSHLAEAQQQAKIPRFGHFESTPSPGPLEIVRMIPSEAFAISAMWKGRTSSLSTALQKRNTMAFPPLMSELVSLKPDVILTHTTTGRSRCKESDHNSSYRLIGAANDLVEGRSSLVSLNLAETLRDSPFYARTG